MCLVKNCTDFAKNSSIHGIRYTVDFTTSILERIFWSLIIISSLSFSIYLTTLFWSRYTSNPTRTLMKSNVAPITTVPFPGITICNLNSMLDTKLERFFGKLDGEEDELLVTKNVVSTMMLNEIISRNSPIIYNISELAIAEDVLQRNGYVDIKRIAIRISQSCDELILRCAWNKIQVHCKEIFEETFTIQGRCCSFNYVRKDSFKHALYNMYYGLSTGLRVTLIPAFNNRSMAGVTVTVHNPRDFPAGGHNMIKTLPLGRVNYLQIQGVKRNCSGEVKKLHFIHRQCIYSDERKLEYFDTYSYSNCLSLCEALMVVDRCKCVPYFYDFIYESPDCYPCLPNNTSDMTECSLRNLQCLGTLESENAVCNTEHLTCLHNITDDIFTGCDCPSQCEAEFYDVTLTTAKFSNNSKVWMMDHLKDLNNTENSILLNIFFTSNRQTVWLRDTITSGIYLTASFGGIYSLFLGCSIITLIEIMYYLIGKCFIHSISPNSEIGKPKDREVAKIFTFKNVGISRNINKPEYYSNPVIPYVN